VPKSATFARAGTRCSSVTFHRGIQPFQDVPTTFPSHDDGFALARQDALSAGLARGTLENDLMDEFLRAEMAHRRSGRGVVVSRVLAAHTPDRRSDVTGPARVDQPLPFILALRSGQRRRALKRRLLDLVRVLRISCKVKIRASSIKLTASADPIAEPAAEAADAK